jgi:spermidine synthase
MAPNVMLVVLFAGSGAAALIYEVVWQQLLQLVIGSSTVSLGVLLGVFMGGMCLGGWYAPRLITRRHGALRVYAMLEFGIGVYALMLLGIIPLVTQVYVRIGGLGAGGVLARAMIAAVCLLPPTFAMGATLPVISRAVRRTVDGRAWLGWFYAGNLAGAVAGCLAAGFYLLRVYDMHVATYVAVALNVMVAWLAWRMSGRPVSEPTGAEAAETSRADQTSVPGASPGRRRVLVAVALSGFTALAAEVVWTRTLALAFGATVYTFSLILAVFLFALGVGSTVGAALSRRVTHPANALAHCQWLVAVSVAWTAYALSSLLPYWPDASTAASIWTTFAIDLARTVFAILPAPLFWGASFAFALAAADTAGRELDSEVGAVYAVNTLGAIAGAVGASLLCIPLIGSQHTQQLIVASALLSAITLWRGALPRASTFTLAAATLGGVGLVAAIPALPGILVAYGRHASAWQGYADRIIYVGEGLHASVAVSRNEDGVLNYHNAGKVQASSEPADMRLQRMLGHLTTLIPGKPRRVLVIGCGAGVTAGAVSVNPAVESVTIVDIEPLVPRVARQYFGSVNHDVLKNPKVRVIADDARHFLQTTSETFDAITSDPLDPWVKGAATLYTREFFDIARAHLNPGGVMTLYVQLFESSRETVRSEMATFFEAFPDGLMFGNVFEGHAIDSVLVGPTSPPEIWLDEIESGLRQPALSAVDSSLVQADLWGATDLFGSYAGRARDLRGFLAGAQVNRDRDLRLQYVAGLGLNNHIGGDIYGEILSYRSYPDDLFRASESTIDRIKAAMEGIRE